MKYARFKSLRNEIKYGIVVGDDIEVVEGNVFEDHAISNETHKLDEVKLLAPVEPSKILCIGLNYRDHAEEFGEPVPHEPMIFLKPPTSIVGPKDYIQYPSQTQNLHYEVELAIVIGKRARNITRTEALNHVFGYTIGNDVTARDLQALDSQWTRAKGFDTFCPLGPWIETEINDPDNLEIKLKVNNQVRQDSNTRNLFFKCAELIEYLSGIMTLLPGDVIMTGTPSGIGPIQIGDKIEAFVENIGVLENYVSA